MKGIIFHIIIILFSCALPYCSKDSSSLDRCIEDGKIVCPDGECQYCCDDNDCSPNNRCDEQGQCVKLCLDVDENCQDDPNDCCEGSVCDIFKSVCTENCGSDSECRQRSDIIGAHDLVCIDGYCDFVHCKEDMDCDVEQTCENGNCTEISCAICYNSCSVFSNKYVFKEGLSDTFYAIAFFTSGAYAPAVSFTWQSSDEDIATIDVYTGKMTAGTKTGTAMITASVFGEESTYCSVNVYNYGSIDTGSRILVIDDTNGTYLQGAEVKVGEEDTVTTDDRGELDLSYKITIDSPADIMVSRAGYECKKLMAIGSDDVIVPLSRSYQRNPSGDRLSGGMKSMLNFGRLPCEPGNKCEVLMGLAGLSMPSSRLFEKPILFASGRIMTIYDPFSTKEVPLPEGMVLARDGKWSKEFATPTGIPGDRLAWAMGARLEIDEANQLLDAFDDNYIIDESKMLPALDKMSDKVYTALSSGFSDIRAIPEIVDVTDSNGNGMTDDYIPDYDSFPEHEMTLKVRTDCNMAFTAPVLPVDIFDAVVVVPGILIENAGFVPLGFGVGLDEVGTGDIPDGIIEDPIKVCVAEVAGRVPEYLLRRVVLAFALNTNTPVEREGHIVLAGQVLFLEDFWGSHQIDDFISPTVAIYNQVAHQIQVSDMSGRVDMIQAIVMDGDEVRCNVMGRAEAGLIDIPVDLLVDSSNVNVELLSIDLRDGMNFQGLAEFNDINLSDTLQFVKAFSMNVLR